MMKDRTELGLFLGVSLACWNGWWSYFLIRDSKKEELILGVGGRWIPFWHMEIKCLWIMQVRNPLMYRVLDSGEKSVWGCLGRSPGLELALQVERGKRGALARPWSCLLDQSLWVSFCLVLAYSWLPTPGLEFYSVHLHGSCCLATLFTFLVMATCASLDS